MKKHLYILSLIFVFSSFSFCLEKNSKVELVIPDSLHYQIIETRDGSTWNGTIVQIEEKNIQFKTSYGTIEIPRDSITRIDLMSIDSINEGVYWIKNPNTTRLFFAPTARMLEKNEAYFADYMIFFPSITYGVFNNFTIGGGMSILPGVSVADQLKFITPKFGFKIKDDLYVAAGLLYMAVIEAEGLGIAYGVTTYGDDNRSLTLGFGYGFYDGKLADNPIIMFGGESRISNRISLVSENWLGANMEFPVFSLGFRFIGKYITTDFALGVIPQEGINLFPYIDFIYKFK